jgi:hypothetical protein
VLFAFAERCQGDAEDHHLEARRDARRPGARRALGCDEATVTEDLTLTRTELEQLCETVQPKRMADWLTARGRIFEPARGRSGFPKVDRAHYLARMSGRQPGTRRAGPRLGFMLQPR